MAMKMVIWVHLFLIFSVFNLGWAGIKDSVSGSTSPGYLFCPVNLLSEYVKIESVTGNEKAAGEFLAKVAAAKGLHVTVFTDQVDSYNFAASLYPLEMGKPNVLFLNHIDVVPAGDESLWTYPPWAGVIADGYVWGRGSIDNKSLGVMQLEAIAYFVEEAALYDMPFNFTLLSVSNEEQAGFLGAGIIVEQFLNVLNPVVVYGEGGVGISGVLKSKPYVPYFGIEIDQKTSFWFKVTASDPYCGHGAAPLEVYPAKQIADLTSSITNAKQPLILTPVTRTMFRHMAEHEKGLRKFFLRNPSLLRTLSPGKIKRDPLFNSIFTNAISITAIGNTESALNQKAHTVWVAFDCRLLPGIRPEEFLHSNRKHFGDLFDDIEILAVSFHGQASEMGPFYFALSKAIMEVYVEALTGPILFPAGSDNSYFREKGIPTYGLNPVILTRDEIGSIHHIDEKFSVESLEPGIEVYKVLINKLLMMGSAEGDVEF